MSLRDKSESPQTLQRQENQLVHLVRLAQHPAHGLGGLGGAVAQGDEGGDGLALGAGGLPGGDGGGAAGELGIVHLVLFDSLIANLAMSLAAQIGEPVGIIDADLQFGDMAVFFNLEPKSTIVEATRDVKFLSPVTLNSYFVPVPEAENIRVLCGTKMPEFAEMVEIAPFEDMVRMAKSLFRYVLIDLPPGFNPISVAASELADTTYMVAMVGGGYEVLHMKRALEVFKAWPDYESRVKTIFTRVSPCTDEERKILEKELEYPISAILPNEYLLVSAAANSGRMAVDIQPDTPLSVQISRLSKDIMGHRIRWGEQ